MKNHEVNILEVEINKISLKPGDVLLAKVTGPDFKDDEVCDSLAQTLRKAFPSNKVGVLYVQDNTIDFSVISQETVEAVESASKGTNKVSEESTCNTQNYCDNCNCGKKAKAEESTNELPKEE
jgi:hypothetical protein